MTHLQRREVLRGAIAVGAATGLALVAGAPAQASPPEGSGPGPDLPEVPGMYGDRLANELWYTYEMVFVYQATLDTRWAYKAISDAAGLRFFDMIDLYLRTRRQGTYPQAFYDRVAPARDSYAYLSRLQLDIYRQFYDRDWRSLALAFIAFGEGSLYDPRMPVDKVHTMNYGRNGAPPRNYHTWHAIIRAMTMLDIDVEEWNMVDRFVGMGWAAQSIARPITNAVNPPLDRKIALELLKQWRHRSPDEMDVAFDAFPYPVDLVGS
jgi:hypothetical protein